jgi:hypothetical protein
MHAQYHRGRAGAQPMPTTLCITEAALRIGGTYPPPALWAALLLCIMLCVCVCLSSSRAFELVSAQHWVAQ